MAPAPTVGTRSRRSTSTDLALITSTRRLIAKTVNDMEAAAVSANVDPGSYQVFNDDLASYESARGQANSHFHDPQIYYTQHLRGFFRGWATQKAQDQAALTSEVNTVAKQAGSGGAVVRRDASILGQLGVPIPSESNDRLTDAYVNTFAQGSPSPATLAEFRTVAISSLGATASASRTAAVDRLISDAPSFFKATGSTSTIRSLVNAVVAVVNDGQGASLNPFKISIIP